MKITNEQLEQIRSALRLARFYTLHDKYPPKTEEAKLDWLSHLPHILELTLAELNVAIAIVAPAINLRFIEIDPVTGVFTERPGTKEEKAAMKQDQVDRVKQMLVQRKIDMKEAEKSLKITKEWLAKWEPSADPRDKN